MTNKRGRKLPMAVKKKSTVYGGYMGVAVNTIAEKQ